MTRNQATKILGPDPHLHISYSQLWTYLSCSLRYKFQYVENRLYERISSNLFLGSSIHSALERYFKGIKNNGAPEPLAVIHELFEDCLTLEMDHNELPVIYKREAPDRDSLLALGKAMLTAFYQSVDLNGHQVVDVELPLAATLYSDTGESTDFKLIGVIDLLLMDKNHELLVVDFKTAAKPKSQDAVDDDLQFTAYSYLLSANRFTFPTAPVQCRMDVLRKLKTPKLEHYLTCRTAQDRRRFAKLAVAVLQGIDQKVFLPNRSWLCSDCQFFEACQRW